MSFSQALSGLNAMSSKLNVLGNNIANSETVGYKNSGAEFASVFAGATGLGTRVSTVRQDFTSGNLESTGRNLDLAVAGTGFLRLQQAGEVVYSRNGQLNIDASGRLINAQGAQVMGYGMEQNEKYPFSEVVAGGAAVPLVVPADDMPAQATGTSDGNPGVQAVYNLNASIDETDASLKSSAETFDSLADKNGTNNPANTTDIEYHYSNSYSVYDSLGNAHTVTAYFLKTADNQWDVKIAINGINTNNDFTLSFDGNGQLTKDGNGDVNGVGGTVGNNDDSATLSFDSATGTDILGTGADDLEFDLTLLGTTQYANDSTNTALQQDGYSSGALVGVTIEKDGTIMRNYTNEQSRAAGQIVLANFRNPEGLEPVDGNGWKASEESGPELLGEPGSGMLGSIQSQAIETANVDLAKQLVEMIVTQRAYQANSQTIKTQDEVLQASLNLSR
ncbi:flagellar hook protein FlgE [Billgrantia azerbaijanica]|nr:flagellar hook protein FlgE [Halomonas azerbaijanica]